MGFYRYLLAVGVLTSHVGGGNWVISLTAVFCFYFVSGFLICRVLDTSYRGGVDRLAAFYCNRALRLLPLYFVVILLTAMMLLAHGSNEFIRLGDGAKIAPLGLDSPLTFTELLPLPIVQPSAPIVMLYGHAPKLMPQAWSIAIEISFYLVAPILVLIARRSVWPLLALAVAASAFFLAAAVANIEFDWVESVIYKNAYTSAFMFFWGGVLYVVTRDTAFRIPFAAGALILAAGVYYYYFWAASRELGTYEPERNAFIFNILLGIPLSAVVCLTAIPASLRRWESRLGDLSYGIYLNHFMVAMILLWLTNILGVEIFGSYNHEAFGWSTMVASSLFAALTFRLIERPIDSLRRKIKRQPRVELSPAPQQQPAPMRASDPDIPGVVPGIEAGATS
jgi:peptidoglycan/LPS O-acetylase OafA/YrhL